MHEAFSEVHFITLDGEDIAFSLTRSKKRKRTISYKFGDDSILQVRAPIRSNVETIKRLLRRRASWILSEQEAASKRNNKRTYADGAIVPYLGYPCRLSVTKGAGRARACTLSPNVLHVHVPDETLSNEGVQHEVRMEILLWIKRRAREKLKLRLDLWAKKLGVQYKKFMVSNPQSRWGSCSADNVIRLNWKLIMAPLPLIDYVAAHELCHIKHKNHSRLFWAFLEAEMPDYLPRRKNLRRLERELVI